MSAEFQEILALAIVVLVAGYAISKRIQSHLRGSKAACDGCYGASDCGGREPIASPLAELPSSDALTSINLRRRSPPPS